MVLDAIRTTGNEVPHPVTGNWTGIQSEIEELHSLGLLSIDRGAYRISKDGKKALLTFRDLKNDCLKEWEAYKEVLVNGKIIDARIGLLAFKNIGKINREDLQSILQSFTLFINWEFLLSQVKRLHDSRQNWQERVASGSIFYYIETQADPLSWRQLGETSREAARTAALLLNPAQNQKSLIQITKHAKVYS